MTRMALALLALVLTSCGTRGTLHPDVLVDDTFTPDETKALELAAGGWEAVSVAHAVRLPIRRATRADVIRAIHARDGSDRIYVVRIGGLGDTSCPCLTWTSACGGSGNGGRLFGLGETFDDGDGRRVLCIDVETKNVTQVFAHEIGHALYQSRDHFPAPSVMVWDLSGDTLPTIEDGARLHE